MTKNKNILSDESKYGITKKQQTKDMVGLFLWNKLNIYKPACAEEE